MTTIARIAAAAAIALAAIPVVAAGAAHAETQVRIIRVADLDLARADHVAQFDARVSAAAREICPIETRQNSAKAEACRQQMLGQAIARLGAAQRQKLASAQGYSLAAR